jgi:hypothetical protein
MSSHEVATLELAILCSRECWDHRQHTDGIFLYCLQWASILDSVYAFWAKYRLPITGIKKLAALYAFTFSTALFSVYFTTRESKWSFKVVCIELLLERLFAYGL